MISATIPVSEVEVGKWYHLDGNIINGWVRNAEGNQMPYVCKDSVSRRIIGVRDGKIYCECGRVFIVAGTTITKVPTETYAGVSALFGYEPNFADRLGLKYE